MTVNKIKWATAHEITNMLSYGIIEEKDLKALSTIPKVCRVIRNELFSNDKESEKMIDTVTMHCEIIKCLLNYSPALKSINEHLIGSVLADLQKTSRTVSF